MVKNAGESPKELPSRGCAKCECCVAMSEDYRQQLDAKINTLDSLGCGLMVFAACCLFVAVLALTTGPGAATWVDKDVNLLRYEGELYRAVRVRRPLIDVQENENENQ